MFDKRQESDGCKALNESKDDPGADIWKIKERCGTRLQRLPLPPSDTKAFRTGDQRVRRTQSRSHVRKKRAEEWTSVRNKRGGGEDEAKSSLALHFPLGFGGSD